MFVLRQPVVEPFHPLLTPKQTTEQTQTQKIPKLPNLKSVPPTSIKLLETSTETFSTPKIIQVPSAEQIDMNVQLETRIRGPDSFEKISNVQTTQPTAPPHTLPNLKIQPIVHTVEITNAQPTERITTHQTKNTKAITQIQTETTKLTETPTIASTSTIDLITTQKPTTIIQTENTPKTSINIFINILHFLFKYSTHLSLSLFSFYLKWCQSKSYKGILSVRFALKNK